MKLKVMVLGVALMSLIGSALQAGETVVDKQPIVIEDIEQGINLDAEVYGMYTFGSGSFADDYAIGVNIGFNVDELVGLEGEYNYLFDAGLHVYGINGYVLVPVTDMIEFRPFAGGGGWGSGGSSRGMLQGGLEMMIHGVGPGDIVTGARYTWLSQHDNFTGVTLGYRLQF